MKKVIALFLAVFCMLTQISMTVSAAPVPGKSGNMDVVLVLDTSGSMNQTDPQKVALEGAKLFVDMMETTGSRAGVVAFTHEIKDNMLYRLTDINSDGDKKNLKNFIENLAYNPSGDTNIGAALSVANELLEKASDVGNEKMILFFTDGKIDLPKEANPAQAAEDSKRGAEQTIAKAAANGTKIYTIGLNANGSVDEELISKMAADTGGKKNVVTNAEELPAIFNDIFANFVESEIVEVGDIVIKDPNTYEEVSFTIPNDSVLEANVVMITKGKEALNEVVLTKPDGSQAAFDGKTVIEAPSNNYRMLKLIAPSAGTWNLKVKGDQGCQVHVNTMFNYDVNLVAKAQEDGAGNLIITATLEKQGAPISDTALYAQMTTTANVTRADGSTSTIPMALSGTEFTCTVPIVKGEELTIYAHTEGANMYRDSDPIIYQGQEEEKAQIISLGSIPSPIEIKGFLPFTAKKTLDLNNYFGSTDPANNTNYYSVDGYDPKIISPELKGSSDLVIKGKKKGSTVITVIAKDAEGNTLTQDTEIIVKAVFGSIIPLILIPLVLIILIVVILIIILSGPKPLKGYLHWQIQSENGSETPVEDFDLTFAGKKTAVNSFITDFSLAYAGLDKVELAGTKSGFVVQNKSKACRLMDEYENETKKLNIYDGAGFKIACQTDEGEIVYVCATYQREMSELFM